MIWKKEGDNIFIRIDPDEHLVATIKSACDDLALSEAAILSGVGMLSNAELGFFSVEMDDYVKRQFQGIFDLSVVCGNVTRKDGVVWPHVHSVFNDTDYNTISGHVIEATCHITIELFLSTTSFALQRSKVQGCPATRILLPNE